MPSILPLTNDGSLVVTVPLPPGQYTFTTRWNALDSVWMMDVADGFGNPVINGLALVEGAVNLLQGLGIDTLAGYVLQVVDNPAGGDARNVNAWGNTAAAVLYDPGETPAFVVGDPMLAETI
jgi:hypothetical protein